MMKARAVLLFFLMIISHQLCAMQEPAMVHIQKAQDAVQFADQVVAYNPVIFINDFHAYAEKGSGILNPVLHYGYITPVALYDEHKGEWEKGHFLSLLVTLDVRDYIHHLVTRFLRQDKLYMRRVTPHEAAYLLQVVQTNKAHFESRASSSWEALLRAKSKL